MSDRFFPLPRGTTPLSKSLQASLKSDAKSVLPILFGRLLILSDSVIPNMGLDA